MKVFLLHIVSVLFYWPLVTVLFLYLIWHPDKMATFFIGMEAITKIMDKKKGNPNDISSL